MPNPENVKPHEFKPGQSGNPDGYSRGRRITDRLIKLIEDKQAGDPLASVWLREALSGDPIFFRMMLDRVEGTVTQNISIDALSDEDAVDEHGGAISP